MVFYPPPVPRASRDCSAVRACAVFFILLFTRARRGRVPPFRTDAREDSVLQKIMAVRTRRSVKRSNASRCKLEDDDSSEHFPQCASTGECLQYDFLRARGFPPKVRVARARLASGCLILIGSCPFRCYPAIYPIIDFTRNYASA